ALLGNSLILVRHALSNPKIETKSKHENQKRMLPKPKCHVCVNEHQSDQDNRKWQMHKQPAVQPAVHAELPIELTALVAVSLQRRYRGMRLCVECGAQLIEITAGPGGIAQGSVPAAGQKEWANLVCESLQQRFTARERFGRFRRHSN